MNIGDLMEMIAKEAERQGFLVRQTRKTAWHFRKEGQNWFLTVREPVDVLDALALLTAPAPDGAGLHWPAWDR